MLPWTMAFVLFATSLIGILGYNLRVNLKDVRYTEDKIVAKYAAESGVDYCRWAIREIVANKPPLTLVDMVVDGGGNRVWPAANLTYLTQAELDAIVKNGSVSGNTFTIERLELCDESGNAVASRVLPYPDLTQTTQIRIRSASVGGKSRRSDVSEPKFELVTELRMQGDSSWRFEIRSVIDS